MRRSGITQDDIDLMHQCCELEKAWVNKDKISKDKEDFQDFIRKADGLIESSRQFRREHEREWNRILRKAKVSPDASTPTEGKQSVIDGKGKMIDVAPSTSSDRVKAKPTEDFLSYSEASELDDLKSILASNPTGKDVNAIRGRVTALNEKALALEALSSIHRGIPGRKN